MADNDLIISGYDSSQPTTITIEEKSIVSPRQALTFLDADGKKVGELFLDKNSGSHFSDVGGGSGGY